MTKKYWCKCYGQELKLKQYDFNGEINYTQTIIKRFWKCPTCGVVQIEEIDILNRLCQRNTYEKYYT